MSRNNPHFEIERRFLVPLPLPWYARFKLHCVDKVEIHQTYLTEPGEGNSRVRIIKDKDKKFSYSYTRKKPVSRGICEEIEIALNYQQYISRLERTDRFSHTIVKDRYSFDFHKQRYELDIFKANLAGLAILEIELKFIAQSIVLPPFLKIVRELTGNDNYSNMNLAKLDCAPK